MVDTYVNDLESRIEYLESMTDKYKGFICKLDQLNPRLNLSDVQSFISIEGILGFCQDNLKVNKSYTTAREVSVIYEIRNHNDDRLMNVVEVIHYTKEKDKKKQISSCLLLLNCLWDNYISKKINLVVDIMDSEKFYDPFAYGRI